MRFEDKHSFEKPAATVLKMFSDRAYFEKKYAALGYTDIEVLEHKADARKFRIKVRYTAPNSAPVPDFAKKFLGATNVVTQTDAWDLERKTGRLEAEIKGVPVKVAADMKLADEGAGATNSLKWNLDCGIPFVGGKLEQLVAADIQSKAQGDLAQSRELLKGY
jgi:carbon monoxide dehydrogenase subunit G